MKTKGIKKVLLPPTIIRDLQTSTRTKREKDRKKNTQIETVYVLGANAQMMIWDPLACFCVSLISPSILLITLPELRKPFHSPPRSN